MSGKNFIRKNHGRIILFLIVVLLFIYNIRGFISKNEFKSSYSSIKVVVDGNYPPYSFISTDGTLQGVTVDQWKLWQSKTGIKVELSTAEDWNTALNNMKQGRYDVIDNIFYSDERNRIFDFTESYADIDVCIFYNKNIPGIVNENSIKGFNVAVKKGDYSEHYLISKGITNLTEYASYEDIIKDAAAGRVSIFIMDKPPALYYLYKYSLSTMFYNTQTLYSNQFHRAAAKGNQELLTTVEKGFSMISKNEYMAIDKKWFGTSETYLKYSPYIIFIGILAAIILAGMHYISKSIAEKIREKNYEINRNEQNYTDLFNELKVGIAIFSKHRKMILSNPVCREMFGRDSSHNDMFLMDAIPYLVKQDGTKMDYKDMNVNKAFETGMPVRDYTLGIKKGKTGQVIWVRGDCIPRHNEKGEVESVVLTLVNMTERIQAVELLKKSENKTKAIIKAIPDMIFTMNYEGQFLEYLSGEEQKSLYTTEKYIVSKNIRDIYDEKVSKMYSEAINQVKVSGELVIIEYSSWVNSLNFCEARLLPLEKDTILVLIRDITERKNAEKRIFDISMKDITTGLYNRNYFEEKLTELKNKEIENIGIIICDIDGLKFINDTMGHAEGDNLIKNAASLLKKCCREKDIISRIGGDEFAVIVKNTSEAEMENYKNKIIQAAEELNALEPVIPISMSAGYSFSSQSSDLYQLFKEADTYMYREKLHHHQSKRSKNIELMTKMLEARDFITEGHGERMQALCVELARAIGMTEAQIKDIILFAQFHDIGKVGIPDAILFKPGKLNQAELEKMMMHTEIGYRIAESSPDIVHISDWILKHHERWDGKGYPYGLSQGEIPLQCRILAIVDAYDAMTNHRPYRKAMKTADAILEIKACAGSQFDPYLVEKFMEILSK